MNMLRPIGAGRVKMRKVRMSGQCRDGAHDDCTPETGSFMCVCMHHVSDRMVTSLEGIRKDNVWKYTSVAVPASVRGGVR